jgi:hypothetical protein
MMMLSLRVRNPLKLFLKLDFGDSDDEGVNSVMEMTVDFGDGDDECSFRLR